MKQKTLRVGLIGYGAVGQDVAHLVAERAMTDIALVGTLIRHPAYPRPREYPKIVTTFPALLAEQPHVVVNDMQNGTTDQTSQSSLRILLPLPSAMVRPMHFSENSSFSTFVGMQPRELLITLKYKS